MRDFFHHVADEIRSLPLKGMPDAWREPVEEWLDELSEQMEELDQMRADFEDQFIPGDFLITNCQ